MTHLRIAGLAAAALMTVTATGPVGQPGRRGLSGDLTKPLAQYSGDEFFALARGLRYGEGNERQRRCRGSDECTRGRTVSVRAEAVADADSLSPATLPANGVIAARVINHGASTESRYGMQGGGRTSYFLVVLPGANNTATWKLEELAVQGNTRSHRTVSTGKFTSCNHTYVRGARADFKTCMQAAGASLAGVSFSFQGEDPPIWVACASGCCIAEE